MRLVGFCLLVPALLFAPSARAEVFTVGADGACTHTSILAAIFATVGNGPELDEIRVANNMTHTGVVAPVVNQSLHVVGGFADCTDTTPSGRTAVTGTTAGTNGTFATSGNSDNHQLVLSNLELRDAGNNARRGGALRIEGDFAVTLNNVSISGNRASRGGGVYLDGSEGAMLTIASSSIIFSNTATVSGGGIYCRNGGLIQLHGAILINTAEDGGSDAAESGRGGGVALFGCSLYQIETPGLLGVQGNTAAQDGGGYFLRNAAGLVATGNSIGAAQIVANRATDSGGGMAIDDDPALGPNGISQVELRNARVEGNVALIGAGIAALTGGDVIMERSPAPAPCHDATYCSSLSFNEVANDGDICIGAAVLAGFGSTVRIRNTLVDNNCPAGSGWAFRQRQNSQLRIDSSVVTRNGGSSPFFIEGAGGFTGLLEIAWSTVVGNIAAGRSSFIGLPPGSENTGTLRIYGSILGEPFQEMTGVSGFGSPPPMTREFDCLVLDPFFQGSLTGMRGMELAAPYGLMAPATGNFRLASGTAAPVDYCDESLAARAHGDADGRAEIYDAPRTNLHGTRDIGAYEFVSVRPDGVFADGFE